MESTQQKRERLIETIKSCEQEINNPNEFSSPAMVVQFKKGLAEAERQLNELNAAQPAQQPAPTTKVDQRSNVTAKEPVTAQPKPTPAQPAIITPNVPTTPNVTAQEALKPEPTMQDTIGEPSTRDSQTLTPGIGVIGGKMPLLYNAPFKPQQQTATGVTVIEENSPEQTISATIHSCNSAGSLFVKIVWVGGNEEMLLEGQCRSKFTSRLSDCAESRSAMDKNWGKLKISNSFRKLVSYYKALSHYPRPSSQKWPTIEDIGAKYFMSENRKKLWLMIQEEIITEENAAKQ